MEDLPVPVIVGIPDAPDAARKEYKVIANAKAGRGQVPIFLGGPSSEGRPYRAVLEAEPHALVCDLPHDSGHWEDVFAVLSERCSCGTLMIEGGATVISSLLKAHHLGQVQIDALVITVGPTMIGPDGVGYEGIELDDSFRRVRTELFGNDTVMAFVRR